MSVNRDEDVQVFEPHPGRQSLLLRLQGTDAQLEPLALVGHTDVVPAGDDWDFDPFCGDLVDGEILGRGAIDMLSLTATMATSIRHVVDSGLARVARYDAERGIGTLNLAPISRASGGLGGWRCSVARINSRSTMLRSWRTLPGQSWVWRIAVASSANLRTGCPDISE